MTWIARLCAIALMAALAGCNTVQGFGRDMQTGGEALSGASEDVQEGL